MNTRQIPIYYFQGGDEQSLPFELVPLELRKANYDYGKPHRHNYFEIFYFEVGGGSHEIDFREYTIHSRSIHFVSPGQVHLVKRAPGSHGHVLLFRRDFYHTDSQGLDFVEDMPFFYHNSARPVLTVPPEQHARFQVLLEQIVEEYGADGSGKLEALRSLLSVLLINARRVHEESAEDAEAGQHSQSELVRRFRRLIENHFHEIHSVSEYANILCISPNHLNDICRKALGRSASDTIHDRIILEAKRLLFHSNISIKEISFALNFQDPSYFGRFFRKHVGLAPGSFRGNIREMYQ